MFRMILLLLWKNLLLQRRHYITTGLQILLPGLLGVLLALMRTQLKGGNYTFVENVTYFPLIEEQELIGLANQQIFCPDCLIAYTPDNIITNDIMNQIKNQWIDPEFEILGFETEDNILNYVAQTGLNKSAYAIEVKAAIIFEHGVDLSDPSIGLGSESVYNFPHNHKISYKIRLPTYTMNTKEIFPWFQYPGPNIETIASYIDSGFTGLQIILDKILINILTKVKPTQEIRLQAFPYPPYIQVGDFNQFYFILLPQFLVLGFIFIVPSTIQNLVAEKETGIKELMKLMGLPNWSHYIAWMINSLLLLTISITMVIILLFITLNDKSGPVLVQSNPSVWWFILFLYVMSCISFCFFVSTFTEKSTLATTLGIVIWLMSYYSLSIPMEENYRNLSFTIKILSTLIPNIGLHWIVKVMCGFEGKGVGAQWWNIFEPINSSDGLTIANISGMFIFDTILYIILTLYIENIIPSHYGVRKPWYYIFQPSTWISFQNKMASSHVHPINNKKVIDATKPGFESEPADDLIPGVIIHDLCKTFNNGKIAVDNVNLNIYHGHITALLGHNGAGKTTTMSILTGLYKPSSGTAIINGYDLNKEMYLIRKSLGLCPQHNMLFDKLTVEEHLLFFGRLKGLTHFEAKIQVNDLIHKLQLNEKKYVMSSSLSGGQKRKLSIGMAVIGGSKVVFLDEPTSGMDPEARRVIWDLLLELRINRTIILTTHFMEEADILGDRIAIMVDGKIHCCGTPMFLKKYFGKGYTLKMTIIENTDINNILAKIHNHIPTSCLKDDDEKNSNTFEISITLPQDSESTSKYGDMFTDLSNNKNILGIQTIGLSLTTMDEVFLRIGELKGHSKNETAFINYNPNSKTTTDIEPSKTYIKLYGSNLILQQFWGLLLKRCIYYYRTRRILIIQLVMPSILLIAAILLSTRTFVPATPSPSLKMTLDSYATQKIIYSSNNEELSTSFEKVIDKLVTQINGSVIDELVQVGKKELGTYREEYIIALDFTKSSSYITGLFSSIPYSANPLVINLITNTILELYSSNNKKYKIETSNHPLEIELYSILEAAQPNPSFTFLVPIVFGVFVPMGLALFAASYTVLPIEERLTKAKQLQLMTGVSPLIFWTSSYVWDFIMMLITIIIMMCCFPIFQSYGAFTSYGAGEVILIILLIYGYSTISFSYLCSLFVSTPAGGFAVVTVLNTLTGIVLPIIVFTMDNAELVNTSIYLRYIGRHFSTFGASLSIMRFASIATKNSRCQILSKDALKLICTPHLTVDPTLRQCCSNCDEFTNYDGPNCFIPEKFITWTYELDGNYGKFHVPGIAQELIYMLIMGLIYKLFIYFIESSIFKCNILNKTNNASNLSNILVADEDVQNENERVDKLVQSGHTSQDGFIANNLCKIYGKFSAVTHINFGVHPGECFGLLGVNGAGKTTTFKMITGDESPTHGNSYIGNDSLDNNHNTFLSNIGYCPQFDGIIGVLTGKEILELFCRLRGVPTKFINIEVQKWLIKIGLIEYGNIQCQTYSGGMKRRLSIGIAMISDPIVILLDEPTSGVDPIARRQFWKIISGINKSTQCVILTSHSMDECEALCSRLGIMVNGQLQCLGGIEYLKNKFIKGYTFIIKLKILTTTTTITNENENKMEQDQNNMLDLITLKNDIIQQFSPCQLVDEHKTLLKYQVTNTDMSWDVLFNISEELKSQYHNLIEDYSISQTSLEEIFLSFASGKYPSRYIHDDKSYNKFKQLFTCKC